MMPAKITDTNSDQAFTDLSEMPRFLDVQSLELAYEKSLRQTDIVYGTESARQLRVRIILLEDENDDLHDQLALGDDRIDVLETSVQEVQDQLEIAGESLQRAQSDFRIKTREVETLKAGLHSMNGMSMDVTKLLTEKLALARELSALKPEVEHLRSQVATHQSLLAEKLSLQRQLTSVQVELETEKRATQRALAKEGKIEEHDARLEAQFEELRKEVAKERRERQRVEREAQKELADWEGKKTILEGKLDAFRNKLRITKEQLKEAQNELQKSQTAAQASRLLAPAGAEVEKQARNIRKRSAAQLDKDAAVGTPGALPVTKKRRKASTLPGDKSTFSITPFLNRTSVAPEFPLLDHQVSGHEDEVGASSAIEAAYRSSPSVVPRMEQKAKATSVRPDHAGKKHDALTTAKIGKANAKRPPTRKRRPGPPLEQVAEEDQGENVAPTEVSVKTHVLPGMPLLKKDNSIDDTLSEDMEGRKKKRRLLNGGLGRTLFDDNDGEGSKGGDKGHAGSARVFGTMRPKGALCLGLGAAGFGSFSPLKKDRKSSAVP
ncbi:MAG: hypothetical protein FRX48_03157 [Lasallia pustulata]|uniref:Uncharacterized protein n=1 Tax=Lasallia pustulata TaxID=136370 RepID=A0A5M8PWF3_9LECA|nr:MAG: hypothetical protein FRX48_03157 [Lasallia pustulata]